VALFGLMVVLSIAAAFQVRAQGTIWFANNACEMCAAVYDCNGLDLLRGTNYLAQLYVGPLGGREDQLKAVDYPPVPFKSGPLGGYFFGGTYVIADSLPGTVVTAQVRAWTAISGSAYEEAVEAGMRTMAFDHRYGKSNLLYVGLGGQDETGSCLWGLMPFSIYPPPYRLEATRSTNHIVVAWPAVDTNYVLEASETLRPANWAQVPQGPSVQGDKRLVTEEVSETPKFYRLRRL
jgi:hypothetical protein